MNQTFTVHVQDDGKLDPAELADFLFLFRGAYAAAIAASRRNDDPDALAEDTAAYLTRATPSTLDGLFTNNLRDKSLATVKISYESPLQIVFVGIAVAIAAAAVLSGGKLKAPGFAAELNPIGDGIKKLKAAFKRSTKSDIGYGLRGRTVKLSTGEYQELVKHTRSTGGGFQRFLSSLALRVNRTTRTLDLTEDDIERIIRHGRKPGAGGFQARIKKIFGQHFAL